MTIGLLAIVIALVVYVVTSLLVGPPQIDFTANHQQGQPVNVTLETVGSYGLGAHPTWVSYLIKSPTTGQWVHTTLFKVPAHTRINVTIYQFDSGSPLRNQQIGQITGTIGSVAYLNGVPRKVINSNAGNGVGHTFSMPSIGLNVPLYGNNGNANLCGVAPCLPSSKAYPHNTIQFSFESPSPGNYPWQCFVPCALGFLFGNGGPMQTIGYMDGFMQVVS